MKKTKVFFISSMLFTTAVSSFPGWEGIYELENGCKVIRHPQKIQIDMGGIHMSIGKNYTFSTGTSLNRMCATADGMLTISHDQEQFENEVRKFGSPIRNVTIKEVPDEQNAYEESHGKYKETNQELQRAFDYMICHYKVQKLLNLNELERKRLLQESKKIVLNTECKADTGPIKDAYERLFGERL